MAAGAYKGLTIRIGADTTKLSSALRGANSVIYKTQSEFRKLSQAAKIDPGNNGVVKAQIGAIANEATASAAKFDTLKRSIEEMRAQASKSDSSVTLGQLADTTENAALAAENAKERYYALSDEIARVAGSVDELSGIDLSEAVRQSESEYEKAKQAVIDWARANQDAVEQWGEKNDTTLHGTINYIEHLRDLWGEANREFEDAKMVESLHNAGVEATTTEAKINSLGRVMAQVNSESDFAKSGSFDNINTRMQVLNAAAETATDRFRRLDGAFRENPKNIGLAVERAKALSDATEVAKQKADTLKQKIESYKSAGFDNIAKSIGNVSLELEESKQEFTESETALRRLEGELDNAQKHYQRLLDVEGTGGGNMADEINEAAERCDKLETALEEARQARDNALDRFDTAKACSELQEMEASVRDVETELRTLGDSSFPSVRTAAVNAAKDIGDLMREAGQKVVQSADEIDSAYRDMRKTVDGTEEQYKALYDAAMKYSQTHVTSADTMLEMEALAGQVGISAEALQNFSEVAANLDVATDISADEIALKMGQIVNVMSDLDEDNVRGFADALVDLGNHMPAQESAIMQIAQRLSSVGDVAGFSTPEILGWSAAIASTGQRSEAAATGISTTISTIQSAVSNGGDDLKAFADALGVPAEELAEKWRTDASGALRDFIGRIQELGPDAIKQLEDLGIEGVRQTQTILGLAKTVENVDKAMGISQGAWDGFIDGTSGVGAAAEEAERKAQGFSGSLAKLENSAQVLAASFGPALVPYLDMAANALNRVTEFVDSLDDGTRSLVVGVGGAFAAFAVAQPILSAFGGHLETMVIGGVGKTVKSFVDLKNGLSDAGAALSLFASGDAATFGEALATGAESVGAFGTAVSFMLTPVGMAVTAIGALAALVGGVYVHDMLEAKRHSEEYMDALIGIQNTTKNLGQDLVLGAQDVKGYADSWSAARVNMDEYIDQVKKHNDANKSARDTMNESLGMLSKYQEVIGAAVGQGENFTGSIGELQWALDGLSEITGETYDINDVLAGSYKDSEGKVIDLKNAIDKLIESKKREAKLNALEDIYSETYKGQMESKMAVDQARKSLSDYVDVRRQAMQDAGQYTNETAFIRSLKAGDEEYQKRRQDLAELRTAYREYGEQLEMVSNEMSGVADQSAYLTASGYGVREGVMQTNRVMHEALESIMGLNDDGIRNLAQSLEWAGVSEEQFASMSGSAFKELVDKAGGSISTLVQLIAEYNSTNFEEKYADITFDENGWAYLNDVHVQWDESASEWKPVTLEVDSSKVSEGVAEAEKEAESAEATVDVTADTSDVEEKAAETKENIESTPIEQTVTTKQEGDPSTATSTVPSESEVKVIVATDTTALDELNSALEQVQQDYPVNVTVTADTSAAGGVVEALATIPESITTKITAKQSGIASAAKNVKTLADNASKMSDTRASYTASGNAATSRSVASNIAAINSAAKNMSGRTQYYNAYGNAATSDAPANRIWNLVNALRNLPTSKSVTVNYNLKKNGSAPAGAANSATGTYIPYNKMPKHAAGIFTQPTLTNIGWVGEDGAELYSGNSLVPLTNRKYSMPYINDISDAVARKLGDQQQGPTISITVNGVAGPDETADAIERKLRLLGF